MRFEINDLEVAKNASFKLSKTVYDKCKVLYRNLTQRNYDNFVSGRNNLAIQNFKDKKKYSDSFSGKIHSWKASKWTK